MLIEIDLIQVCAYELASKKTIGLGSQVGDKSHTFNKISLMASGGSKHSMKTSKPEKYKDSSRKALLLNVATYNTRFLLSDETLIQLETELGNIKWDVVGHVS